MKNFFLILPFFVGMGALSAQISDNSTFEDLSSDSLKTSIPYYSGFQDYFSFRIPTLIKSEKALIAFAEGRKNSTSDFGDIDLVYRRSLDEGKTWEPLQLLFDQDTLAVQNSVPIYVTSENKVVLLFNTSSLSEHDVLNKDYSPEEERRAFVTSSADDGETWEVVTEPTDFTPVKEKIETAGFKFEDSVISAIPKNTVQVVGEDAEKMIKLLETLEDADDVQKVYANFDIDEKELERISA